jgi:hypothetical protein
VVSAEESLRVRLRSERRTSHANGLRRPTSWRMSHVVRPPSGAQSFQAAYRGRQGHRPTETSLPPARPTTATRPVPPSPSVRSPAPHGVQSEELKSEADHPPFDHIPLAICLRLTEQRDHPLVRTQAQCVLFPLELPGDRGLTRSRKAHQQDHRRHVLILTPQADRSTSNA